MFTICNSSLYIGLDTHFTCKFLCIFKYTEFNLFASGVQNCYSIFKDGQTNDMWTVLVSSHLDIHFLYIIWCVCN